MRLKKVSIRNFLSFDNLEVEFNGLNFIVGPNNSGKSNVIRALRKLSEYEQPSTDSTDFFKGKRAEGYEIRADVELSKEEKDILFDFLVFSVLLSLNEFHARNQIKLPIENVGKLFMEFMEKNREIFGVFTDNVALIRTNDGIMDYDKLVVMLKMNEEEVYWVKNDSFMCSRDKEIALAYSIAEVLYDLLPEGIRNELVNGKYEEEVPSLELEKDAFPRYIRNKEAIIHSIRIDEEKIKRYFRDPIVLNRIIRLEKALRIDLRRIISLSDVYFSLLNFSLMTTESFKEKVQEDIPADKLSNSIKLDTERYLAFYLLKLKNSEKYEEREIFRKICEKFKELTQAGIDIAMTYEEGKNSALEVSIPVKMEEREIFTSSRMEEKKGKIPISLKKSEPYFRAYIIFEIGEEGERYQVKLDKSPAGFVELLFLLSIIMSSHQGVIALDEPALNLHPLMQRKLVRLIEEKVDRGSQAIIITHSPHFLSEKGTVWRLFLEEEATRAVKIGYNEIPDRLRFSHDVRSLLFSNGVILVEGDTELGALPILNEKCGKLIDFEGDNIAIQPVGGSGSFKKYVDFLEKCKISYVILADKDSEKELQNALECGYEELLKRVYLWPGEFEDIFSSNLREQAESLYKRSKVLKGRYMAEEVEECPEEVKKFFNFCRERLPV